MHILIQYRKKILHFIKKCYIIIRDKRAYQRSKEIYMLCYDCPRGCDCDRSHGKVGYCNMPSDIYVSKYMLHPYEEPCISGVSGAGTVFFSGCNLKCIFCQNKEISRLCQGERTDEGRLLDILTSLSDMGAECIEFATPTHYTRELIPILEKAKARISKPFVWNCGGYESVGSLKLLEGLIDIYMPDIKYFSDELALKYSHAKGYYGIAVSALKEMIHQTGMPVYDSNGMLLRGTLMRHLVLPGCRKDSADLLTHLADEIDPKDVILSLMSQYTPDFYDISCGGYKDLTRRVTSFEYNYVLDTAISLGFDGYFQSRGSSSARFTPSFLEEGDFSRS